MTGDTYSKLWKFYGTRWWLFMLRFRGKIVIISAWLRPEYRHRALLSSRRQLFACVRSARANDLRFVFSFFASDTFDVEFGPKRPVQPPRTHIYTHTNSFSAPLFRLLHFSRSSSSHQLAVIFLSRLIPPGKIYWDKNEIYESVERILGRIYGSSVITSLRSISSNHVSLSVMHVILQQVYVYH